MKTLLFFISLLFMTACSNDDETSQRKLPPETQTGANTFGVTINGKVYVPRDPTGVNVGGATPKGMRLLGGGIGPNDYTEIVVVDGASAVGFKMVIHFKNLSGTGTYLLYKSNFQDGVDSWTSNNIHFKIWDSKISSYAYYGSIDDDGVITITRLSSGIISGIFSGKFVRYDKPTEFITITDGRFDINGFTIQNHPFP